MWQSKQAIERIDQALQGYRDKILTADETLVRVVESVLSNLLDDVETWGSVAMGLAGTFVKGANARVMRVEISLRPGSLSVQRILP